MTTSGVSHSKVSAKSDDADTTLVRPSDWNDDHVISYVKPSGLTGATAASRYAGATAGGAPTSGTFAVGDFVVDQMGKIWTCTVAGTPGTWTSGSTAAGFIGAYAYSTGTSNIGNGAFDPVALAAEVFDTDGFHDNSTNNNRMTIPAGLGGKYLIIASVEWDTSTSGSDRLMNIHISTGSDFYLARQNAPGNATNLTQGGSKVLDLAAGDWVSLQCYQNSGSTRTVGAANGLTSLQIVKLDSGRVGQGIGCRATRTTDQTGVVTSTDTPVQWNAADEFDTDGFHDPSTNNSRMTIPAGLGGKYLVIGAVIWDTNTTNFRHVKIRKNGTTTASDVIRDDPSSSYLGQQVSAVLDLVAGDYVELCAYQDSGTNRTLSMGTLAPCYFQVMRLDSGSGNYTGPLWGSGTAFPSGPADGQRFTRTDRHIDYFWSASASLWLSVHLYKDTFGPGAKFFPFQNTNVPDASGRMSIADAYDLYIVDFIATNYVGATNNGSNYYGVELGKLNSANASTSLGSYNTSADTQANWTSHRVSINQQVVVATYLQLQVNLTKTGSPGDIYVPAAITFRYVG